MAFAQFCFYFYFACIEKKGFDECNLVYVLKRSLWLRCREWVWKSQQREQDGQGDAEFIVRRLPARAIKALEKMGTMVLYLGGMAGRVFGWTGPGGESRITGDLGLDQIAAWMAVAGNWRGTGLGKQVSGNSTEVVFCLTSLSPCLYQTVEYMY
jgi:hypothetical protein